MSAAAHVATPQKDPFAWTQASQREKEVAEEETLLTDDDIQFSSPDQQTTAAQAILGIVMFGPAFYLNDMKNARDILKDPKLAEKLFDFKNPQHLQNATNAIKRRGELLKGKKVLGIRIRTFKIDQETAHRATLAYYAAKKVHREVERQIGERQIQATISRYGFEGNEQDVQKLRKSLDKWMKEHPKGKIEDGLFTESRRIMKERSAKGGGLGRIARSNEGVKFTKELKKIREDAITQFTTDPNGVVAREKRLAERIIDPKNPSMTASEVRDAIRNELTGEIGKEQTTVIPQTTSVPSQPAQTVTAQQPAQLAQGTPRAQVRLPGYLGNIQNRIQNRAASVSNGINRLSFRVSSGFNNAFGGVGRRLRFFGGLGGGGKGFALGGSGGNLLGGENLLSKGANLLADGAKAVGEKIFKSMLSGISALTKSLGALNFAAVAVAVVVIAAVVYPIAMTLFGSMHEANVIPMPNKPIKTTINARNRLASNWKSFEGNYLTYNQNRLDIDTTAWHQFEKDYLSNLSYLTNLIN